MTKEIKSSQPKEADVMASILGEMGVSDYEPGVINQMLEFTYRYVTQVLDDARAYANYAKKSKVIETDDIKLAVCMQVEKSLTMPPPRDLLLEIGRSRNVTPLPPIKSQCGIRLPPDRYCLSACNMQMKASRRGINTRTDGSSMKSRSKLAANKSTVSKSVATPSQKVVSVNKPIIKVSAGPHGSSLPKIQISSGTSSSIKLEEDTSTSFKRKRDNEDYDV